MALGEEKSLPYSVPCGPERREPQSTLDAANSSVTGSGSALTVVGALTFQPSFAGFGTEGSRRVNACESC